MVTMAREGEREGGGGEGEAVDEIIAKPPEAGSLRKLRQEYARAVKSKVASSAYVDNKSSDSESESEDDESDSEDSSSEFESMEEPTSVEDSGSQSAAAAGGSNKKQLGKKCVCDECGVRVSKPALLIQHKRSHSNQKPFVCPESGCGCAYKRQDHLNRHLKKHRGVVYFCPLPGCHEHFTLQANLRRHLKKAHKEKKHVQSHICSWPDCGKVFRYPSLLRTHEKNVHEKLECDELYCIYPGCGDKFSSEKALVTHSETCHPYLLCEVCGETIPRKSFLRHVRTHATKVPLEVVCPYDGCGNTYTRESNLRQHVRSVHLQLKPFVCSHEGCNKIYAHKAALDRHARSAVHSQPRIDFQDRDQLLLSKPRGGRKPVEIDRVDTYVKAILGR